MFCKNSWYFFMNKYIYMYIDIYKDIRMHIVSSSILHNKKINTFQGISTNRSISSQKPS